jgi:hypothetical protein
VLATSGACSLEAKSYCYFLLAPIPALQKTGQKRWRAKVSSHSGDQTSVQELVLVKAPKPSMKFSLVGSGLSLTEKAAATMVKVGGGGGRFQPPWALVVPAGL